MAYLGSMALQITWGLKSSFATNCLVKRKCPGGILYTPVLCHAIFHTIFDLPEPKIMVQNCPEKCLPKVFRHFERWADIKHYYNVWKYFRHHFVYKYQMHACNEAKAH